ITDQGWKYNHTNTSPWQPEEVIEYEDDFVVTSIRNVPTRSTGEARIRELAQRSDSDSHDELARRSKTSTRSLKQTLFAIDASLREQTLAIERLSKTVD
ncbi:jg2433, partial [Pararge aegeria aegeria]